MEVSESLAYYMRGAITVFFITWMVNLYPLRRRNRMMSWLFVVTAALTILFFKDVLLFSPALQSPEMENLFSLADLLCIPIAGAFFTEVARPGWVTWRKLIVTTSCQAVFIPVYLAVCSPYVMLVAYMAAFILALLTIRLVVVYAVRYQRYLADNYSYDEHLNVRWVVYAAAVYFCLYLFYFAAFGTGWLSEAAFNFCFMVLWSMLFGYSRRHQVLAVVEQNPTELDEAATALPEKADETAEATADWQQSDVYEEIWLKLEACMKEQKLFLQSRITISDLANVIGTNRTYLSEIIHLRKGTSFYDYINEYRVEEACRLIAAEPRRRNTLIELAERSGFNSVSSFSRYFFKIKGQSPKAYQAGIAVDDNPAEGE